MTFQHEGHTIHLSASFDDDKNLAEIFINSGKSGTLIDLVVRELAVVTSIGLQFGVPLELIENALPKLRDGSPAGPLGAAIRNLLAEARTISAPDAAPGKSDGAV